MEMMTMQRSRKTVDAYLFGRLLTLRVLGTDK